MASDRVVAAASSTLSLCTVLSDESISIDEQNPGSNNNNVLAQFANNEEEEDGDDILGTGSFVEISGFSEVASNIGDDDIDSDYVAEFEDIDNDIQNRMEHDFIPTTIQSQTIIDNDNEQDMVLPHLSHNDINGDDDDESVRSPSVSVSQDLSFVLDSSLSSVPSIRHSRNPTPDESLFLSETIIIQEGEMNSTTSTTVSNRNRNDSTMTPIMDNTRYKLPSSPIEDTKINCPIPSMSCSEKPPQLIGSFGTNDSHCTEEEQKPKHISLLSSLRWNTRDRSNGDGSGNNKKQRKDGCDDNNTSNNCSSILTSKIASKVRSISPVIFGVAVSAIVVAGAILVQSFVSNRQSLLASSSTSQVTKDEDDNNNKFGTGTATFEIHGM